MLLTPLTDKLHCWAWNRIYIKSNGRVPCWCDAGETYTIWNKDFGKEDFVRGLVNSRELCEMRLKIIQDQQYYIDQCDDCCCLIKKGRGSHWRYPDGDNNPNITKMNNAALLMMQKVAIKRKWPIGSIDRIAEIQLEPSFPCNLKCPGCLHGWHPQPMKTETGPYLFPFEWFEKMIKSIIDNKIVLNRIAYVGRGEPTLNKHFPKMLTLAREQIPNTKMSMDTNSNQEWRDEYLHLDWINCSIDGSTPETYSTYRLGGNFESAIKFMRNAVKARDLHKKDCKIRWKYILFDTTQSKSHLDRAQEIAAEIGIDELNYVITTVGANDGSVKPAKKYKSLEDVEKYLNDNKIFHKTMVTRS